MTRRIGLVLSLALVFSAAASGQTDPAPLSPEGFPDVVATVNGTEITKSDLLRRAEAIRSQVPEVGDDFYQEVLGEMIGAELLYQSVASKGLTPTEDEVQAELAAQAERFGGLEAFGQALEAQGLTLDDVRSDLGKDMAIQSLIERDFVPEVTVSEEEKRGFYEENASEMTRPMQFRAAHILIGVEDGATDEAKAEARKKASAILSMAEAGQDFAELAKRNSTDPGSKDSGGELPWMSEGQTVPPFEQAVVALAPGELSDVVETPFGYHVIRLLERTEAGTVPYEEVEERIGQFLMRRNLQKRIQDEMDELRARGDVEVFI